MCEEKLFRGYIKCSEKGSLDKFKDIPDRNLRSWDEIQEFDNAGGVLARNIVLIDVDDRETSDIIYKIICDKDIQCHVRKTTRGKHFFFKNTDVKKCGSHLNCGLSLGVDCKVGTSNSYAIVRRKGENREILRDCDHLDPIPVWLKPMKSNFDFLHMKEGDGRNDEFYRYILPLQKIMSKEEIVETITIINNYIVDDPMSDRELKTILRDEAFNKVGFYDAEDKPVIEDFALYMKNNYHVKQANKQLFIYKDGIYIPDDELIERMMIKEIPSLMSRQRNETLKYLHLISDDLNWDKNVNLIAFTNGVYNLETDEMLEYSPAYDLICKIPHRFVKGVFDQDVDKVLNNISCQNQKIRANLEEALGFCFYRRSGLSKSVMLLGRKGSNGKSVYLDMLKWVLMDKNYSTLDTKQLSERFSVVELYGRMANIADDVSPEFLTGGEAAQFRKLVTGNEIKAEFKGRDTFKFKPFAKHIMSFNKLPRIGKDALEANLRRMVIIPFNAHFTKNDPDFDPNISYRLQSESAAEYLIQLGIAGLNRILKNNDFTYCAEVQEQIEEFAQENNPVGLFLLEQQPKEYQTTAEFYLCYKIFCEETGTKAVSQKEFNRQIQDSLPEWTTKKTTKLSKTANRWIKKV